MEVLLEQEEIPILSNQQPLRLGELRDGGCVVMG